MDNLSLQMVVDANIMKNSLLGILVLLSSLMTGCDLPKVIEHDYSINDLSNSEKFVLNPPRSTYLAEVIVNSDVTDVFSLTIDNGSLFKGKYDSLGLEQMNSVYRGDWYENPMTIIYEGSDLVKGKIQVNIKFYY